MASCLIIRLSSLGDVAMTVPVVASVVRFNPDTDFYMLTRARYAPLFSGIESLRLYTPDFDAMGVRGLMALSYQLKKTSYDFIVDLHAVLRTRILCLGYSKDKVFVLDKGREEKRAIIKRRSQKALKHTMDRYLEVFERAGFSAGTIEFDFGVFSRDSNFGVLSSIEASGPKVGFAPFAAHRQKAVPLPIAEQIITRLCSRGVRVYLFGGVDDKEDARRLSKSPGVENMVHRMSLAAELGVISSLDLMLCTDSANGHLAALAGIDVLTIWGGTDYRLGFAPWNSKVKDYYTPGAHLDCHPCSVYGKKRCKRGDFACLSNIDANFIAEIVFERLNLS